MRSAIAALVASLALLWTCASAHAEPLRLAVLKFGTVNWELDVIRHHGLDKAEGIQLEVVELASTQATKVALQAGSADLIVSDWLWVSRTRRRGADFVYMPYSSAVGGVMVPPESTARTLADLSGKKIGVAGGPLDKSWLIVKAYARESANLDLSQATEQAFGAPPLLAKKAEQRELAAVLNYWPYCARLEALGFRTLIGVTEAAAGLGAHGQVAMIGYVFRDAWAKRNASAIKGFVRATRRAREILANSDAEWQRIRRLTLAEDEATLIALRRRYREGIPKASAAALQASTEQLFALLAKAGGEDLTGPMGELAPGTFWRPQ
jgi:NitT/TauT family transport system substrate-binding protein